MSKQQYNPAEDNVDYDELSRAVEAGDYTAGDVWSGSELRMGRPTKDAPAKSGKTPPWTGRLPEPIRDEMKARVQDGSTRNESELVRQALAEYFMNHPREDSPIRPVWSGVSVSGKLLVAFLESAQRHGLEFQRLGATDWVEVGGKLNLAELAAELERPVTPH